MKIIKIVVAVLGAVTALALLVAAFTRKDLHLERSVTIARPTAEVFAYLKLLKNQDNFSVWANMDPNMKKSYRGTDGSVGFVSAWDSQNKNVGQGEQEIKGIQEGRRLDYELRFKKPMEDVAQAYILTESTGPKETKVTWGFHSRMPYPRNLVLLVMDVEGMVGKDFSTGLVNLKTLLEKK